MPAQSYSIAEKSGKTLARVESTKTTPPGVGGAVGLKVQSTALHVDTDNSQRRKGQRVGAERVQYQVWKSRRECDMRTAAMCSDEGRS